VSLSRVLRTVLEFGLTGDMSCLIVVARLVEKIIGALLSSARVEMLEAAGPRGRDTCTTIFINRFLLRKPFLYLNPNEVGQPFCRPCINHSDVQGVKHDRVALFWTNVGRVLFLSGQKSINQTGAFVAQ
jgi:hypothetical protein